MHIYAPVSPRMMVIITSLLILLIRLQNANFDYFESAKNQTKSKQSRGLNVEINICLRYKGLFLRSWKEKQIHHKVFILPPLITMSEFITNERACWLT